MSERFRSLGPALRERGWQALLVYASSSAEPELAQFVGSAHLGHTLVVVDPQGAVHVAPLTPMERGEAASTGHRVVSVEELQLHEAASATDDPQELVAWAAERLLAAAGITEGVVGLAGGGPVGRVSGAARLLAERGWAFESGHALLERLRKTKSPDELTAVRRAAAGTCSAMWRVAEVLAAAEVAPAGDLLWEGESLTVTRLRVEIARTLAELELEQARGSIVAPGAEGAVPHNAGTGGRVLRAGESLVVDLFPRGPLFADCTRTFCVGDAPDDLLRAHGIVAGALAAAHRSCVAGASGWDLHTEVSTIFEEAGYATARSSPGTERGYVHGLGHGVGYELHELPSFREGQGDAGILEEGDVLTLEPGLYDEQRGYGVRLEDLVVLGADGPEVLTPLPYALDPRDWLEVRAASVT